MRLAGLRIKETKEVYEGEVTELTPAETENPMGGRRSLLYHSPTRVVAEVFFTGQYLLVNEFDSLWIVF